jgi:hypothetical protein
MEYVRTDGARTERIQVRVDTVANRVVLRGRVYEGDSLSNSSFLEFGGPGDNVRCQVFSTSSWTCSPGGTLSFTMSADGKTLHYFDSLGDSAIAKTYTMEPVKP